MMSLIKTLNKGSYSKETQKVLDKWEEYTSSNKKHIDEINNYLNQNAEEERPTPSDLKNRTMNIIKNVLTPKEFSKLTNEVKQMSNKDIKQLVAEVLNENSGMGYGKYPYDIGNSDDQPAEDYIEEWKALAVSLVKDESRDTAVAIAKILVRDLELFEDVLDLAGQNQSVGSEILRKIKETKEN
jgi:predicted Zn-dependent peptidase